MGFYPRCQETPISIQALFLGFYIRAVYNTLKLENPELEHNSYWGLWKKFLIKSINYPAKYISKELPDSGFFVVVTVFSHVCCNVNQARDINDTVKRSNIHIIGVSEGEE